MLVKHKKKILGISNTHMWEEGKHETSIVSHWQFLLFSCKRHLFPTSATALSTAPAFSGNKTKINFMPGAALLKIQRNCQMVFWKQYNRKSCNISCLGDQWGIGCHTWCVTECIQQNHGQTQKHLICHSISCPVDLDAFCGPVSSLLALTWCTQNIKKPT